MSGRYFDKPLSGKNVRKIDIEDYISKQIKDKVLYLDYDRITEYPGDFNIDVRGHNGESWDINIIVYNEAIYNTIYNMYEDLQDWLNSMSDIYFYINVELRK